MVKFEMDKNIIEKDMQNESIDNFQTDFNPNLS